MSAARKLAVVAAVQLLVLLSVLGFKLYAVWTGETVLLKTQAVDPRDLLGGDYIAVRYEISDIDLDDVAGDDYVFDRVYVELQEGDDGYWDAVAVHERNQHSFDGTVNIKGEIEGSCEARYQTCRIEYGIEDVFIPEGSGAGLPSGSGHTVAVEVKVDRFGNATPRRFFVDGEPFDLKRR